MEICNSANIITKSLPTLSQDQQQFRDLKRVRSLPNICLLVNSSSEDCGAGLPTHPILTSHKKTHKQKILRKTWDKVKTVIIHSTTAHSYRRSSSNCKSGGTSPNPVSSAPVTPFQKHSFEFDHPSHRKTSITEYPTFCHERDATAMTNYEASEQSKVNRQSFADDDLEDNEKIQRNYAQLQKRLSEELHQRMSEYKPDPKHSADNLSEEFKKRLQQWEMWKLSTGKVTYTEEELQQLLPEEFSKKLHEWEYIKTFGANHYTQKGQDSATAGAATSTSSQNPPGSRSRLSSTGPDGSSSSSAKPKHKKKQSLTGRQKELAWLEKQLEKVEFEKKRLEREMIKMQEREARLEKMKEALQNTSETEVWIKTPTASCKVEKLTEKFTKKLYEWEEKKGIQPESSTMALLHPKYYATSSDANNSNEDVVSKAREEFNATRYNDDTPAFSSPRDSHSRNEECDEEDSDTDTKDVVQIRTDNEPCVLGIHRNRISSASSSDFEEATTDSFATHEKGNSGASNTDSDLYRADFPGLRRRSSEAISTPLSARSPSLSAFTSDDEGEAYGFLKTVSEENEATNQLKDAESQTEVIMKAKPVLVSDEESFEEKARKDSQSEIFVPTKRTIFTPIRCEGQAEKAVLIEQELKSPALLKTILTNHPRPQTSRLTTPEPSPSAQAENSDVSSDNSEPDVVACSPTIAISKPSAQAQPGSVTSTSSELTPTVSTPIVSAAQTRPPPPRIVEAIPKINKGPYNISTSDSHPQIMPQQRAFPKMGKVPVWYGSPMGGRRYLGSTSSGLSTSLSASGLGEMLNQDYPNIPSSSSIDFSIDRFLQDSNLLDRSFKVDDFRNERVSMASTSSSSTIPTPLGSRSGGTSRFKAEAVPEESGIVGAGIQTGQRHPAFSTPLRSSSFRFRREMEQDNATLRPQTAAPKPSTSEKGSSGFYANLRHKVGSVVTKSQSTGSIKAKLGKALSTITNKLSPASPEQGSGDNSTTVSPAPQQVQQTSSGTHSQSQPHPVRTINFKSQVSQTTSTDEEDL